MKAPIVQDFDGISVVRDDLYPGGTKARFIPALFDGADEVVYASPAQGGAQYALAATAKALGKRATIFVALRKDPHPRAWEAKRLGATIVQVPNGYLNVVQARARAYCAKTGARLAPFGMDLPAAIEAISAAARAVQADPDEVWCAGGSGVLARSLATAWPRARINVVMVGRRFAIDGARMIAYPKPFEWQAPQPPFPSDPHYDAKAWMIAKKERARQGRVLFWNVAGPAVS